MVACRLDSRGFAPTMVCTVKTERGLIFFHSPATAAAVADHDIDAGIGAFFHGKREKKMLLHAIAAGGHVTLAVAENAIVGYVIAMPPVPGERWAGLPGLFETSIEVSRNWRGLAIAHWLMRFTFQDRRWDERIVVAQGYRWHWDLTESGLDVWAYRDLIRRLHEAYGFAVFDTDDPEIKLDDANILLARVGRAASRELRQAFYDDLFIARRPAAVQRAQGASQAA